MSNLRILRLNNCNPNLTTLSTDKSSFTYKLDPDLVNLGRCLVEVVSGVVTLTSQALSGDANSAINATSVIVPTNVNMVLIGSNIPQVGMDSFTGGDPTILGFAPFNTTTPSAATAGTTGSAVTIPNVVPIIGQNNVFLCDKLPSQIEISKLYWSIAATPILSAANNYTTNALPVEIILKLTFIDME